MANKKILKSLATLLLTLSILFISFPINGQTQRQNARLSAATNGKPKLVLVIMVDQFRYDYLERFEDLFGKDGFRRLMNDGAFFTNANYDYVPTYTAPGHAAVHTGSVPAQNGVVGNEWFDRVTGKRRIMVSDLEAHNVTMAGVQSQTGAPSPRVLIGTTIGDQMRLAENFRSKVIAISQKDRSAVLPGGQHPNGAYWFQSSDGTYITSDYYYKSLPNWIQEFNKKNNPDKYFGKKWEKSLPESAYARAQAERLPLQKSPLGETFPYTITGGLDKPGPKYYSTFELSPFATEHLADLAKAAIEGESLGADEFPDFLSVSFSTPDLVGHTYGPDSQEIVDTYARLDKVIADLLNFVDRKIGLQNTIIAMTGDHGVAPIPEYMSKMGLDGARLSGQAVVTAVNKALNDKFGKEEKWVQAFVNEQLYIDPKLVAANKTTQEEVERIVGDAAITIPGVINYFTRTQIINGNMPQTALARRVTNGFNRLRSGDVWVITKPFSFFSEGGLGTTHGSPYNYDTHVPVIIFGKGVTKGRYTIECSPSDIAPTLASLLRIEMPSNRYGRVLPVAEK
jgi:predicted AlkP superfamily pyrophosphatase or phosphodiesterase